MSEVLDDVDAIAKVNVPQGGNVIREFRLTPTIVEGEDWGMEVLKNNGTWKQVKDYAVSFNKDSTPEQAQQEGATLVVTMSDEAVKAGWTFANDIKIYTETSDPNVVINKSLTNNLLTWVFNFTAKHQDASGDAEPIDYGYIALLNAETYIQPDPIIILGRPYPAPH